MKEKGSGKNFSKSVRIVLHGLINLILLVFLTFQISAYLLFSKNGTFFIPEIIRNEIKKNIEKEGFNIVLKDNGFDARGHFIFDNVSFGLNGFTDPIFTANRISVDLNLFYLFFGKIEIESIYVNDGVVWKLPIYGSDHTHSIILDRISIQYVKDFKQSQLAGRTLFAGNNIYFDILLPEDVLSDLQKEKESATPTADKQSSRQKFITYYALFIKKAEAIQAYVKEVQNGSILLKTTPQLNKEILIEARALFPKANFNQLTNYNFSSEAIDISAKTIFPFETETSIDIHATAQKFSWAETLDTEGVSFCMSLDQDGHPKTASLFAQVITYHDYKQYPVLKSFITLKFSSLTQFSSELYSHLFDGDVYLQANVDLEKQTAESYIESSINPIRLLEDPLIPKEVRVELKPLKLPQSPKISGTFTFSQGWHFENANIDLSIRNGSFHEINPQFANANVFLSKKELLLYDARGVAKDYTVTGSFYQNFETLDYRFLLSGSIIPKHLEPILGSFWPEIWNNITLGEKLPKAIVDVSGRWLDLNRIYVRVLAEGENITYRAIHAEEARLLVIYHSGLLRLANINAVRPEGTSQGNVNWFFKNDHSYAIQIDFSGEAYPVIAKQFVDKDVQKTIDSLAFKTAPKSHIKGIFYDPPFSDFDKIEIDSIGSEFTYYGLPIDHANVNIIVEKHNVIFPNIILGLANGTFSGNIFYSENKKAAEKPSIRINGKLVNADAEPFVQLIDKATKIESKDSSINTEIAEISDGKSIVPDLPFAGKIDLFLDVSGPFFVFEKLEGKGDIVVNSENLTTLHSFGFLSRLMQRTMLPSGSIIFKKFTSDYTLSQGIFTLPNVSITSDLAKVSIRGSYNTTVDFLNFKGSLELLGASQSMLAGFFNNITGVFTGMLGFDIYGPIDNPQWIFSNNPTRLFYDPKERSQREQEKANSHRTAN